VRATSSDPAVRSRQARSSSEVREATAAGIYGIIVSAAVLTASHASTAVATAVTVLVTVAIYWAAERYARILAERIHEGHRPRWDTVRTQLTSGWEMITASLMPLGVLIIARLSGRSLRTSILAALVCSTVLLCMAGWRIGRSGRLSVLEQILATAVAGLFGAALILLKALLH
jgi:VIT1/CCC1 family predicted Fe2+/Mn2+ transporter